MRQPFIILLSIWAHWTVAQSHKIDSLENIVSSYTEEDTIKVNLYNQIAFETINTNPDLGRKYAMQGYELAKKIGFQNGYARGLNLVGSSFLVIGEYDTALEFYLKSLEIYEQTQFQHGIFVTYNNIGELYEKKGQFEESLSYNKKSLALKKKYLKGRHPIISHVNLGNVYCKLGQLDSALIHFIIAEDMAKEENHPKAIGAALTGIGSLYASQKKYPLAINYLNQANQIWVIQEDYVGMSKVALEKTKIAMAKGAFKQAKIEAEKAVSFAEKVSGQDLELKGMQLMYQIDSAQNDYKSAFASMQVLDRLKSKFFDLAKERQLQTVQAKFEFEESKKLHEELRKEKALSEDIVKYQRTIIAGIALILLLISIIAFLFYNQVKKQARLNRLLKEKNKEIKEKALELEILNNNLEEMVEERTNVIQKKNVRLKEYSFLNAHIVRGPLANILGLTKLLQKDGDPIEKQEMLNHLRYSANKLDDVLADIKTRLEKGEQIN
ncbi:tetratricopeptide repeat protein [Reichenbachiella carrageenanivorans]|uniref:Tetratricopeptide repeat protein n=1 Tax=Reichenbachiella carrageenanivorans TaxID=2979869 RepID=A0ABY6CX99_9BACT|nr:tetratricopeptide repeat protein [Reichenbachiella carrageenanivorans]UXX77974.1 tetratricopeptide repeat protein [Reichenbachiella carrageenanivorans]